MPRSPAHSPQHASRLVDWGICAALVAGTFLVYAQAAHFGFVNFDDPQYVTANQHVRAGLSAAGAAWAFTSGDEANWSPLTRLSHMLDCQLFGVEAGPQHMVNVVLHAAAALLLFAFFRRATRTRWPGAFVAFLFALHPLHVESVAWISERKDVLSACFWFLALWAYAGYAERAAAGRTGRAWYGAVAAAFALGLMSKPMIVTLPCVLLLLDAWPFGRLGKGLRRLLLEKIPLFALAAAGAAVTYVVQRHGGAVESLDALPAGLRLENALVSYAVYIGKTLWPSGLAVFYPHPHAIPAWQPALAALGLAAVSAVVLWQRAARPYLPVGWFWFVGTLVPVIGLVQVGSQARADRYMYVPMVGLGIMLAWGGAELLRRRPRAAAAAACACCAAMVPLASAQTAYWANSETLFRRALAVTSGNYLAHYNLGVALQGDGRVPDAISEFQAALRIRPDHAAAHNNLGNALSKMPGRLPDAIAEYRAALRLEPAYAAAHINLGSALEDVAGGLPQAIAEYQTAVRLEPDNPVAYNDLGDALLKAGRPADAAVQLETALRLRPDYASAHNNLGLALARLPGRLPEAIDQFQQAVRLDPRPVSAYVNLGSALSQSGRVEDAIAVYRTALGAAPGSAALHNNLGNAWSKLPDHLPDAISEYESALRINPAYADAHYNLALALARSGRMPEALAQFEETLRLRPNPQLRQVVDRLRAARR